MAFNFGFFKKKNEEKLKEEKISNTTEFLPTTKSTYIKADLIYQNNYVDICTSACAVCWDKEIPTTFKERLDYLERRVKTGHTSILEHSNVVMEFHNLVSINDFTLINQAMEFISAAKYLNVITKHEVDSNGVDVFHIITAGSIRGYHHILNTLANVGSIQKNIFVGLMIQIFYNKSYPQFFRNYIDEGVMEESRFVNTYMGPDDITYNTSHDKFDIINVDNAESILYGINTSIHPNSKKNIFTQEEMNHIMLDTATVTVLFKNMSRTATHQLVRHRNGITQESQRYVDYSKAQFTSPEEFKDKYKGVAYDVTFDGVTHHFESLSDIGNAIKNIYPQLINPLNPDSVPLQREDARAFLPSNIQCGKLYMTFTLRNFFMFLKLRADAHAQAEIREYAEDLVTWYNTFGYSDAGFYRYKKNIIDPVFMSEKNSSYDDVDEAVGENEDLHVAFDLSKMPDPKSNPLITNEEPKE